MATYVYSNAGSYDYEEYQGYDVSTRYGFNGAFLGLYALVTIHACIVTILSCIFVKRRADPARSAFSWLKLASLLLFVGGALAMAAWAIMVVIDDEAIDTDREFELVRAFIRTSNLYRLFFAWANAAVLVLLVDLGLGIYSAIRGGLMTGYKVIKYLILFAGFVIFALLSAKYGLMASTNTNAASASRSNVFTDHGPNQNNDSKLLTTVMDLTAAYEIISWVLSLAIFGFSIFVKLKAGHILGSSTTMYLISSVIYLIRNCWRFAFVIKWVVTHFESVPVYTEVLHAVLDRWALVIILSLVYLIGRKKRGGLFMNGNDKFGSMDSEAPPPMRTSNHHW